MNATPVIADICFLISFHESALPAARESIMIFVITSASVTNSDPYRVYSKALLFQPGPSAVGGFGTVAVAVGFGAGVGVADILYFGFVLFAFEFAERLFGAFADKIPVNG